MTAATLRSHVEAYLKLRRSLGFYTPPVAHNLRELLDHLEAEGFSWPIHTQTILDWIGAATAHCGLPGQRMRLIHARCFLEYLKAGVPDTEVPGPVLVPCPTRPPSAGHLRAMGIRFVGATDALRDHRLACQYRASCQRSDGPKNR